MKRYLFAFLLVLSTGLVAQKSLTVNADRLNQSLDALAGYGLDADGQPNRVAFSDGDLEGRTYVIGLMEKAGLETSVDAAGNIIGKRPGRNTGLKPIGIGSHIDMVPHGGNYDGCVGSMAAIEVAQTLHDRGIETNHPLEVIIFSNEEGGVMGSRSWTSSEESVPSSAVTKHRRSSPSSVAEEAPAG